MSWRHQLAEADRLAVVGRVDVDAFVCGLKPHPQSSWVGMIRILLPSLGEAVKVFTGTKDLLRRETAEWVEHDSETLASAASMPECLRGILLSKERSD